MEKFIRGSEVQVRSFDVGQVGHIHPESGQIVAADHVRPGTRGSARTDVRMEKSAGLRHVDCG